MKPGQPNLNELEEEILKFLAKDHLLLKDMINQLRVLSREFTIVGSYTKFQCMESSEKPEKQQIVLDATISIPNVPNGLGAVLFCEEGMPMLLELFAYGDGKWDGEFDGFKINKNA